jgi:peroxiredoxin Q/BCP
MTLKPGDTAPDFTLPDQHGRPVSLGAFKGKRVVVLYFYPKDETRGCTAEACRFRDDFEEFRDAGANVIGVSSDPVRSHAAFAEHHRLPFTLLADEDGAVRRRYGVERQMLLVPGRTTFVIDRNGIIRHISSHLFGATEHVDEALRVVRTLQAGQ